MNIAEGKISIGNLDQEKINSLKFNKSQSKFQNVSFWKIIFQGIIRGLRMFMCTCSKSGSKGEDEKIKLRKMESLNSVDLYSFFGSSDVETGAGISVFSEVTVLTDKMFRDACNNASEVCLKYARFFLIMEKITKYCEVFALFVFPIGVFIEFHEMEYIISICVIVPIILMKSTCDWGILMEKYANLAHEFNELANNKDENRVDKYESLVNRYKSSWLYSDTIKINIL